MLDRFRKIISYACAPIQSKSASLHASNLKKTIHHAQSLLPGSSLESHLALPVSYLSTAAISQLVCVSEKSVRRYIARFELTGDVQPVPHRHGPQRLLGDLEQLVLLRIITENPGIYLHEVGEKLLKMFGVTVASPTICKTLKYMGCSRQVIQHIAIQRSDELRAKFMAEVSLFDPSMLIWLDESGCDQRNSTRKWGYSVRGIPP